MIRFFYIIGIILLILPIGIMGWHPIFMKSFDLYYRYSISNYSLLLGNLLIATATFFKTYSLEKSLFMVICFLPLSLLIFWLIAAMGA